MYSKWRRYGTALLLLAMIGAMLCSSVSAYAQSGGGFDLSWSTLDAGGGTFSSNGGYVLGGTIGQPDAGLLTGGGYTLAGGFWGGVAVRWKVYLPLILVAK